ncbi:MAG: hypothetical protein A2X94_02885 [Bdellovibrionales bacterium GWB1_55_8]|nr:MAG: hypothetical protein A2X94_02885 [Bdellovibrionales bacterium GWB1_55_8]
MKMLLLVTFMFFSGLSAQADGVSDWMHVTRDFRGATVSVDYRVGCYTYSLGQICSANPLWINVSGVRPESSVRAVFINRCPEGVETREVDMAYQPQDGRFTGDVAYGTRTRINGCQQELAVVINGDWSTRYNHGRNFNMDLMNGR